MEIFRDYFETPEDVPQEVRDILVTFDEEAENVYDELARVVGLLENIGWTFEYYLDAEPYNLTPMNFAWWVHSDNVVEHEDGYLTQCTKYSKKFTKEELKQYYQKEYELN